MQQDICYAELDNGVILVTTSYLDRHNDYIQIYCTKDGDDYLLTDDSWTLDNLEQSGLVLESAKNRDILKARLNKFGILRKGTELYIKTGETELNLFWVYSPWLATIIVIKAERSKGKFAVNTPQACLGDRQI